MIKEGEEITKAVLKKLGVDDDVITKLTSEDPKVVAELKADDLSTGIIDTQKEIIQNDEDFKAPIERDARVKALFTKENNLRKEFPEIFTKEVFDKLPENDRLDAMGRILKAEMKKKSGATDADLKKEVDELNAKIVTLNETVEEKDKAITAAEEKGESRVQEFQITQKLRAAFDGMKKETSINRELAWKNLKSELLDKYDPKDEDGKIVLYLKGKSTKATKDSKPITLESAYDDIATENELWSKSLKKPDKPTITDPLTDPKPAKKFVAQDNIDRAIAEKEAIVNKE